MTAQISIEQCGRRIEALCHDLVGTIFSAIKIVVWFHLPAGLTANNTKKKMSFVMGNGPSLKSDFHVIERVRSGIDLFAVNDFALSQEFTILKPNYYILNDPFYWIEGLAPDLEHKRSKLFAALCAASWEITLLVPLEMKKAAAVIEPKISDNMIKPVYYNRTPLTGFLWFQRAAAGMNLGLPSGQNVLLAAIYLAIRLKYKKIIIWGADHSFHEEIRVTEDNVLNLKQEHFDDMDNCEAKPYSRCFVNIIPLQVHELFSVWARAFKGYWDLSAFARKQGCEIYNASFKSYIDAFPRLTNSEVLALFQ